MEILEALPAFAALAQETRLETLSVLAKTGPKGLSAGSLAGCLGASAPTLSFHLKELTRAGLIHSRKEGRSVIYAVDYGGMRGLIDYLITDCCHGDRRLCGPYVVNPNAG